MTTLLDRFSPPPLPDLPRPASRRRAGLFIDLEGTLVDDVPQPLATAPLRLRPGAGEALAQLQQAGLALVIVTNQSGLAHGRFTRAEFARYQQALLQHLREGFGVGMTGVEVCPHGPDREGRPACLCRKPAPGMLVRAARRHGLDLQRSWTVGDTLDDVEAGHRAGTGGLLLDSGAETAWRRSPLREPDARFGDWAALADHVERLAGSPAPVAPDWRPATARAYAAAAVR